jgi:hypothetical protein
MSTTRAREAGARPTRRPGRSGLVSSLGAGLGAVLLPKCPLCVAAVLSSLGLGATAAGLLAVVLRPAVFTLAGAGLVVVAWAAWRAHARAPSSE